MKLIAILLAIVASAAAQRDMHASASLQFKSGQLASSYAGLLKLSQMDENSPMNKPYILNGKLPPGSYAAVLHERNVENSEILGHAMETEPGVPFYIFTMTVHSEGNCTIIMIDHNRPTLADDTQMVPIVGRAIALYSRIDYTKAGRISVSPIKAWGIVQREAMAILSFNSGFNVDYAGTLFFDQIENDIEINGFLVDLPPAKYAIAINKKNDFAMNCESSDDSLEEPIILFSIAVKSRRHFVGKLLRQVASKGINFVGSIVGNSIEIYNSAELEASGCTGTARRVAFGAVH